ncbi:tetratricopeptide repeat protein [bacterium]|nr:MAG: tetratricopeptide repeat protein [bacterium]
MRQLGLWLLIIGTLLALVIVVVQSLGRIMERYAADQQDRQVPPLTVQDSRMPVTERIQNLEKYRTQLRSPERLAQANRDLAVLYEEFGRGQLEQKELAKAEVSYKKAIDLDPQNPALLSNLADVYYRLAVIEPDAGQRAQLWRQSGVHWAKAAQEEPSGEKSIQYREQAGAMLYQFAAEANELKDVSIRADVRSALYDAQRLASPGSQLESKVRELLDTLR